uniref:Uncharacterized protein n=1 Tax=Moniliophthora roreri TaxID=221103 RepID=A0A0W0EUJ7_MONRR
MERVDDMDSRISYTPANAWFLGGVSEEYNSTTHGSQSILAEMSFQFNGTSITVYGTITHRADIPSPVDVFALDDSLPVRFAPTVQAGVAQRHVRMFFSPPLKDGLHTLIMRRTVDKSESWIDYIDYTPSAATLASGEGLSSSSSSPLPSSTTNQSNSNDAQLKSLSPGALAGIIVACVILLLGILILLFLFLKSRKARVGRVAGPSVFDANVPVGSIQPPRPTQLRYSRPSTSQPQSIPATSPSWNNNNTLSVPSIPPTPSERPPRYVVNAPSESASLSAGSEGAPSNERPSYGKQGR